MTALESFYGDEAENRRAQLLDELKALTEDKSLSADDAARLAGENVSAKFEKLLFNSDKLSFLQEILASQLPSAVFSTVIHAVVANAANLRTKMEPGSDRADCNNIVLRHSLYENQKLEAIQDTESFIDTVRSEHVLLKYHGNYITSRQGQAGEKIAEYEQKFCDALTKLPDQDFWLQSQILLNKGTLRPQAATKLSNAAMARLLRNDGSGESVDLYNSFLLPKEIEEKEKEAGELEARKCSVIDKMTTLAYEQEETASMWTDLQLARTMTTRHGTMDLDTVSQRLLSMKNDKSDPTKIAAIDLLHQTIAEQNKVTSLRRQQLEDRRLAAFEQQLSDLLHASNIPPAPQDLFPVRQKHSNEIEAFSIEDFALSKTLQNSLRNDRNKSIHAQLIRTSLASNSMGIEEGFAFQFIQNRGLTLWRVTEANLYHERLMQKRDEWKPVSASNLPRANPGLN